MSGSIKGITISFSADTNKLQKALREINNETRKIDKELRAVDKALKFNPTSVELWRQKQQLLSQKIDETKEKLRLLKNEQARLDASGVDKNSAEYRNLQREIIETQSKLKTFEGQLRKIGNVNLRAMSEQFKDMGNKLESAGQSMRGLSMAAAAVTAAIGAAAVKSGKWADDLNTMSKVYSINTQELQKYSAAANLVDVSVETIAKSHVKLEKQMLTASKGTGASAEAFEALGVSVTNADGSLRDGDAVWQDTIKALGSMSNETERDAYAMQLMGRSAAELNPLIEDGGETYKMVSDMMSQYGLEYVDQETLDKANQFNDALDKTRLLGSVAFSQMSAQLAAYLAPAMEKVVQLVGKLAQWFAQLSPQTQTVILIVGGLVAVLGPLLIMLGKVSFAISSIMSLASTLGPIIGGLASGSLLPIIAIIAGVVAAGIILYKNWDTIKTAAINFKNKVITTFNEFKNKVTTTFNNIKTAIVTPIQNAINTVKGIIDRIKSFFPIKIGKIMSNIKLPHFKLTGSFSLTKMTVPKISIDWYKTGGIFDSPSVIGVGEAGAEAVVPLNKLWQKLDNIANASGGGIVVNVYGSDNMSVNELAAAVEQRLIQMQKRRTQVWQ